MAATHELMQRQAATSKTLAKYRGKPFDWRRCATCLHMARFQLKEMGRKPPRMPPLRSALRARRELDARGFKTVSDLLDKQLERLPAVAFMRIGDLAALPGDADDNQLGFEAIVICVGGAKFAGWHPESPGMTIMEVDREKITAAWRV